MQWLPTNLARQRRGLEELLLLEGAKEKDASKSDEGDHLEEGERNIKNAETITFETNNREGKYNIDTVAGRRDEQLQKTREKIHAQTWK